MRAVLFLVLVLVYLVYIGGTQLLAGHSWGQWLATAPLSDASLARAPDPQRILRDVNRYRAQHRLKPLRYSQTCQAAARIQAQYNANHGTFHHSNTDLPTPGDRLRVANHHYQGVSPFWAENALRYTLSRDSQHSAGWHIFHRYHIFPTTTPLCVTPKQPGSARQLWWTSMV
jgi:hypothetical protein